MTCHLCTLLVIGEVHIQIVCLWSLRIGLYRVVVPVEIRECASSGCCLYFSMLISYRYCGSSLSHFFDLGIREARVLTSYEQSVSSTRATIPTHPITCMWV